MRGVFLRSEVPLYTTALLVLVSPTRVVICIAQKKLTYTRLEIDLGLSVAVDQKLTVVDFRRDVVRVRLERCLVHLRRPVFQIS